MIAREWRARCPKHQQKPFADYLRSVAIKDMSTKPGFKGAQVFARVLDNQYEITLISYWESLESIEAFAGTEIGVAKLYPDIAKYDLEPDDFVNHYELVENLWV